MVRLNLPRAEVRLTLGSPAVSLRLPRQAISLRCHDVIAETFTTPTLVSWSAIASDKGANGITVEFQSSVTAGSPCRVKFTLRATGANDLRSGYTSPEQLSPHAVIIDATGVNEIDPDDRGLTYDLYWSWTSGSASAGPTLVAAAAIYIPENGEGDFPASG